MKSIITPENTESYDVKSNLQPLKIHKESTTTNLLQQRKEIATLNEKTL